jgi:membrane protease YdiL (CAAX protease family)
MLTAKEVSAGRARLDLAWAGGGLIVAVVAALASTRAIAAGAVPDPGVQSLLAYLSTWIPMLAAVGVASAGRGWQATISRLGVAIHPFDLFWGLAGGCFARAIDALSRLQLTGTTGLDPQPTVGTPATDLWLILTAILAPVIIAPIIEELFFRGLFQRSLARAMPLARSGAVAVISIVATSVVFSVVHLVVGAETGIAAVAMGIGTFTFSVVAGSIVATTGRLGGAVVAHVVFNGVAVFFLWAR